MDERQAVEEIRQVSKPIKLIMPDSIRTDHATHLVIQQRGSEFLLLFFELQVPIFAGTLEEQLKALENVESTDAKCIAKIVMSAESMAELTNNVIESFTRFQSMLMNQKG